MVAEKAADLITGNAPLPLATIPFYRAHIVEPMALWRAMSGQLAGDLRIIVCKSRTE